MEKLIKEIEKKMTAKGIPLEKLDLLDDKLILLKPVSAFIVNAIERYIKKIDSQEKITFKIDMDGKKVKIGLVKIPSRISLSEFRTKLLAENHILAGQDALKSLVEQKEKKIYKKLETKFILGLKEELQHESFGRVYPQIFPIYKHKILKIGQTRTKSRGRGFAAVIVS